MAIAESLSNKELELANLVDFYNDNFTERRVGKKRTARLEDIILNLIKAVNIESKNKYESAVRLGKIILWKDNSAISNRKFYEDQYKCSTPKDKTSHNKMCNEVYNRQLKSIAMIRVRAKKYCWAGVKVDVKGHPINSILALRDVNSKATMHTEQREAISKEIEALFSELTEQGLTTSRV
jgi:hypothetical protein